MSKRKAEQDMYELDETKLKKPAPDRNSDPEDEPKVAVCETCPSCVRGKHGYLRCTVCRHKLITLKDVNDLVEQEWRPDHPLNLKELAVMLAIVLQETTHWKSRYVANYETKHDYMNSTPAPVPPTGVRDAFASWGKLVGFEPGDAVSQDEFIRFLEALRNAPPVIAAFPKGLPFYLFADVMGFGYFVLQNSTNGLADTLLGVYTREHHLIYDNTGQCAVNNLCQTQANVSRKLLLTPIPRAEPKMDMATNVWPGFAKTFAPIHQHILARRNRARTSLQECSPLPSGLIRMVLMYVYPSYVALC